MPTIEPPPMRNDSVDIRLKDHINTLEYLTEKCPQDVLDKINTAKNIVDLGSGAGNSALALKDITPAVSTFHLVDAYRAPFQENMNQLKKSDSLSVQYHKQTIGEFIASQEPESLDLIMIASVPYGNHAFKEVNDYRGLASRVSGKGVVIEVGDTNLDKKYMSVFFYLVVNDSVPSHSYPSESISANCIWQKKEMVE